MTNLNKKINCLGIRNFWTIKAWQMKKRSQNEIEKNGKSTFPSIFPVNFSISSRHLNATLISLLLMIIEKLFTAKAHKNFSIDFDDKCLQYRLPQIICHHKSPESESDFKRGRGKEFQFGKILRSHLFWWHTKKFSPPKLCQLQMSRMRKFWFDKLFVSLLCWIFPLVECDVVVVYGSSSLILRKRKNKNFKLLLKEKLCYDNIYGHRFPPNPKTIYLLLRSKNSFLMLYNDDAVGTDASRATRIDS